MISKRPILLDILQSLAQIDRDYLPLKIVQALLTRGKGNARITCRGHKPGITKVPMNSQEKTRRLEQELVDRGEPVAQHLSYARAFHLTANGVEHSDVGANPMAAKSRPVRNVNFSGDGLR